MKISFFLRYINYGYFLLFFQLPDLYGEVFPTDKNLRPAAAHLIVQLDITVNYSGQSFMKQASPGDNENNQTLLPGVRGGGFLEKSPPGRRRQKDIS
jgi:hypothetical protein